MQLVDVTRIWADRSSLVVGRRHASHCDGVDSRTWKRKFNKRIIVRKARILAEDEEVVVVFSEQRAGRVEEEQFRVEIRRVGIKVNGFSTAHRKREKVPRTIARSLYGNMRHKLGYIEAKAVVNVFVKVQRESAKIDILGVAN